MLLFTVSSLKKITLFWINSNTAKFIHLLLQMKYQQWQMQEPCIKARKAHVLCRIVTVRGEMYPHIQQKPPCTALFHVTG